MFDRNYFAARQFAPRYFEPVPASSDDEIIAPGRRVSVDNAAVAHVEVNGESVGNVTRGGMANARVKRG